MNKVFSQYVLLFIKKRGNYSINRFEMYKVTVKITDQIIIFFVVPTKYNYIIINVTDEEN